MKQAILILALFFCALKLEAQPYQDPSHVFIISIDGLSPKAIELAKPPVLKELISNNFYNHQAHTILPPKTIPSHASMLSGVEPAYHGALENGAFSADSIKVPTLFDLAAQMGMTTAFVGAKPKLEGISALNRKNIDVLEVPWLFASSADSVAKKVIKVLKKTQPHLFFIHFADVDAAGHRKGGWLQKNQLKAVLKVDQAIGKILDTLKGNGMYERSTIIITADHGGHSKNHGEEKEGEEVDWEHRDPASLEEHEFERDDYIIPWLAIGRCAPGPVYLMPQIKITDTAATAAALLNIPVPFEWYWTGKVVFDCQ